MSLICNVSIFIKEGFFYIIYEWLSGVSFLLKLYSAITLDIKKIKSMAGKVKKSKSQNSKSQKSKSQKVKSHGVA